MPVPGRYEGALPRFRVTPYRPVKASAKGQAGMASKPRPAYSMRSIRRPLVPGTKRSTDLGSVVAGGRLVVVTRHQPITTGEQRGVKGRVGRGAGLHARIGVGGDPGSGVGGVEATEQMHHVPA